MFFFSRPSQSQIRQFLHEAAKQHFSYDCVGASRELQRPDGFVVDHNRQLLGNGKETFDRAMAAIESWTMFAMPWIELVHDTPPREGMVVCVRASHLGFYSLNACKVVYCLNETVASKTIYGFAYGTLNEHAESGEERFCVEWDEKDDSVHYDLFAFSKPGSLLTKLAYPLARSYQRRFAAGSKLAMLEACSQR
ncbi:MAG TPA: DUF1990 domain-containing protein [Planktothrix sp.]